MAKAIAIAAVRQSPFELAFDSAKNTAFLIADFMYGTKQRSSFTLAFALGLAVLGSALDVSGLGRLGCAP